MPFFQISAVFFSLLLRYASPFLANFPVTPYYSGIGLFANFPNRKMKNGQGF